MDPVQSVVLTLTTQPHRASKCARLHPFYLSNNGGHFCKPVRPQVRPQSIIIHYISLTFFEHRATVIRFPNSTFEARIHLPGAAAHIDVVPHGNFLLVTGSLTPRVRADSEGRVSTLLFSDQPCGVFGRDIPVNLAAGTEVYSEHLPPILF